MRPRASTPKNALAAAKSAWCIMEAKRNAASCEVGCRFVVPYNEKYELLMKGDGYGMRIIY